MNKTIFAFVCLTLFLFQCKNNRTDKDVQLIKAGNSLRIPISSDANSTTRNVRYFQDNGEEYLAVENKQMQSISIYKLSDCSHVKDVFPHKQGPNGLNSSMSGFDIINFDTIIVSVNSLGDKLFIIDSAAVLKKTIECPINSSPLITPSTLSSNFNLNVEKIDTVLFVGTECRDYEENFLKLQGYSIGYLYNLKTEKVSFSPKAYPNLAEANPHISLSISLFTIGDRCIVLSFMLGHQLFVSKEDTTWTEYCLKSKYITQDFKPRTETPPSISDAMKDFVMQPEYRALVYDKYRNVYYRFVYPGIEVKHDDDVFKLGDFFKVFSIMIIDKDFNVIGETLMPENTYNMNMFFVNEAGLWLSTNHVDNPNFEEDAINFELFTLE